MYSSRRKSLLTDTVSIARYSHLLPSLGMTCSNLINTNIIQSKPHLSKLSTPKVTYSFYVNYGGKKEKKTLSTVLKSNNGRNRGNNRSPSNTCTPTLFSWERVRLLQSCRLGILCNVVLYLFGYGSLFFSVYLYNY